MGLVKGLPEVSEWSKTHSRFCFEDESELGTGAARYKVELVMNVVVSIQEGADSI